jgi:hypothetical protein
MREIGRREGLRQEILAARYPMVDNGIFDET